MRIALLQPSYWPEVRRGTERLVHDLGTALSGRGHDVTVITSHRGPSEVSVEDGIRVVRARRPPRLSPLRRYEDHLDSTPSAIWHLLRGRYDVAHAFHLSYAWAGLKARRVGGPPLVFSFHGLPIRRYLVERRYRLEMIQATLAGAAATTVLSEAAGEICRRYLLVDPIVLPGGVFGSEFRSDAPLAGSPTLLCAASLGDPRKRASLLFSAFEALRARRPDARLLCVRTPDPLLSPLRLPTPEGVSWIDFDSNEEFARAYGGAWASVLPAVGEAFGLVLIESLAAGTPVVATRDGGCPEIVDSESIGRLFEPDDEAGLLVAMDQALELAQRPGTSEACREHALRYDWDRLTADHEALYQTVLSKR